MPFPYPQKTPSGSCSHHPFRAFSLENPAKRLLGDLFSISTGHCTEMETSAWYEGTHWHTGSWVTSVPWDNAQKWQREKLCNCVSIWGCSIKLCAFNPAVISQHPYRTQVSWFSNFHTLGCFAWSYLFRRLFLTGLPASVALQRRTCQSYDEVKPSAWKWAPGLLHHDAFHLRATQG